MGVFMIRFTQSDNALNSCSSCSRMRLIDLKRAAQILIFCSSSLQTGLVYTCSRLVVNVSQSYLPLYLTETLKFEKVSIKLVINRRGLNGLFQVFS